MSAFTAEIITWYVLRLKYKTMRHVTRQKNIRFFQKEHWFSGCTKGSATTILKTHPIKDRVYIELVRLRNVNKFWLAVIITTSLFLWHCRSSPCNGGYVFVGCISRRDQGALGGCNSHHPFLRRVSKIGWTGSGVFGVWTRGVSDSVLSV